MKRGSSTARGPGILREVEVDHGAAKKALI
jgi:hypothetical protein